MSNLEKFINKSIIRHGDRYDYSKVEYINSLTKVCIICPEHGEFWQTPQAHVRGNGCPICANKKRGDTFRGNSDWFIKKANEIHNNRYDYSKVEYVNASTKVCIICPEHGEFMMTPMAHLNGQGCPKCSGRGLSTEEVVKLFREKHEDKYDYSKVVYNKMHEKVCIICPKHGEFFQTPSKHLLGQECPRCAKSKRSVSNTLTTNEFIEKARLIHGDKYDYSKTIYNGTYNDVTIGCKLHGYFSQRANDHLNGHGCPVCGNNISINETEIANFIKNLGLDVISKDRNVLKGKEIDIFVPSKNIGIEYDGLYWHSNEFKDKNYHLDKTNECANKGIRLIHIFEDEWNNKQDIVKSMLRNILGKTEKKEFARKCSIREVNNDDKVDFLNKNHLQGNVASKINIGLYDENNELVSIMCFGHPRVNLGRKEYVEGEYELLRFCNVLNTNVIGGASKLFKYFIETYHPMFITSYCDRRWSIGNMYEKLGFTLSHSSQPNYYYVEGNNRKNRFKYRKSELIKEGYDENKSESDIMDELGIHKIYDCGTFVFQWKKM